MLKSLLRRIAETKQKVQKGAKYDKINLADDVRERSPLVKQIVDRTARIFLNQTLGEDITVMPEDYDTNQAATLSIQEFVLTSVAKNPAANLLLLEIVASGAESIEVEDNLITISINGKISTHNSIKALIDADEQASSLITVEINAGEGLTLVTAEDKASFSGALG